MASLGAGIVVTGLLYAVGQVFHGDTTVFVLAGLALAADSAMRIVMVPFWASERMRYEALSVGIQEAAFVVLAAAALLSHLGAFGVMVAYLVSRWLGSSLRGSWSPRGSTSASFPAGTRAPCGRC